MSIAVSFAGNVGSDPELRFAASGTAVLGFSVATRSYDKKEGEQTTWLRCSLFGKRAETMGAHLKKGSSVFVRGSLKMREYVAHEEKRTSLDVMVDDVEFIGGKGGGEQGDAPRRPSGGGPGRGRSTTQQRSAPEGGYADEHQMKGQDGGFGGNDDIPFISLASDMHPWRP